jgi:hypothetical protein
MIGVGVSVFNSSTRKRGGFLKRLGPFWLPIGTTVVTEDTDYLKGLEAKLQAVDGNLSVAAAGNGDSAWRISTSLTSAADELQACRLADLSPVNIAANGLHLIHEDGVSAAVRLAQCNDAADWIQAVTGVRPTSFAYPYHLHTRGLMAELIANGWLFARDGDPHGTGSGEPLAGFYCWCYAGKDQVSRGALVLGLRSLIDRYFPDLPFFGRDSTEAGARIMRHLGFFPFDSTPHLFWRCASVMEMAA